MLEIIVSSLVAIFMMLAYDYFRVYRINMRVEEEVDRLEDTIARLKFEMDKHVANFKSQFNKFTV
jgi:branched-subunit amino acid aminotransferase/4-amino-4-deoxychorismate lyase